MKFQPVEVVLKSGGRIIIREAVKKDAANLLQTVSTYIMESEHLISFIDEFNPTKQDEARWIQSLADSRNSILLVADYNGSIIGNIDVKGEGRRKVRHNGLLGIGILKKWQKKGVGTALMQSAIEWSRQNVTIENLWLNVHAANIHALTLYKNSGFTECGLQKNYIKNPDGSFIDNILMHLDVSQKINKI